MPNSDYSFRHCMLSNAYCKCAVIKMALQTVHNHGRAPQHCARHLHAHGTVTNDDNDDRVSQSIELHGPN